MHQFGIPGQIHDFFFYISGKYWWVEIYNAISFKWSISDRSVVFIYLFVRVVHLFIQMKRSSRADRQNITFSMFFTVSQNLQWHLHMILNVISGDNWFLLAISINEFLYRILCRIRTKEILRSFLFLYSTGNGIKFNWK